MWDVGSEMWDTVLFKISEKEYGIRPTDDRNQRSDERQGYGSFTQPLEQDVGLRPIKLIHRTDTPCKLIQDSLLD